MSDKDFEDFDGTSGKTIPFKPVESPEGNISYWEVGVYQFLHDCFHNNGGFLGKEYSYLVADKTENYYNTRKLLSHFINDMERFIEAQYMRIFTDIPPEYSSGSTGLMKNLQDVDRRGSYVDEMKMYGSQYALLDGTIFMGSGNDGVAGKLPWYIVYTALEFNKDLSTCDSFNNIDQYVFEVKPNTYHVYTDDKFVELYDKKGVHNAGSEMYVPDLEQMEVIRESDLPEQVIKPIYSLPSYGKEALPNPNKTYSIAKISLNIFELQSRMVQLMTRQLFDRLVISGDIAALPDGMTNATVLESETASAQLLSPDSSITQTWLQVIDWFTMQLYEKMRDGGVIITKQSQAMESGYAKEFTFQPVEAAYKRSIRINEKIDAYIQDAYNLWMDESAVLKVEYNMDYIPQQEVSADTLEKIWNISRVAKLKELSTQVVAKSAEVLGIEKGTELYKRIVLETEKIENELPITNIKKESDQIVNIEE